MDNNGAEDRQLMLKSLFDSLASAGFWSAPPLDHVPSSNALEMQSYVLGFPRTPNSPLDTGDSIVYITVPGGIELEVHGHCAVIRQAGKISAELELDGPAPSGFSLRTGVNGQQVLAVAGRPTATRLLVRTDGFRIIDRGVSDLSNGWNTAPGDRDLRYLLETSKSSIGRSRLLVIFSAIGDPYDFTYNYKSSLTDVDYNKLFILDDFGTRGSYYWMDHQDESIYRSVQDLIIDSAGSLGISTTDIVFTGSSKGGTAAILHGVSLGVKEVWAGAPQYQVGDYLFGTDVSILRFMSGGKTPLDRDWLNDKMRFVLKDGHRNTMIRVVVGSKDHHLASHVQPLIADAGSLGYSIELTEVAGFPHAKIGELFGYYLTSKTHQLSTTSAEECLPYAVRWDAEGILFMCWRTPSLILCVDMYGEDGAVTRLPYTKHHEFRFALPRKMQPLRFRVFKKSMNNGNTTAFTTRWFFPNSATLMMK